MHWWAAVALGMALAGCEKAENADGTEMTESEAPDTSSAPDDAVFFLHSSDVEPRPDRRAWNLPARILRDDPRTGVAMEVEVAGGWSRNALTGYDRALEIIVLEGDIAFSGTGLAKGDYLRIPAGEVHRFISSECGARLLLFFEDGQPGRDDPMKAVVDTGKWQIVRDADAPWVGGTAMAEAGREDVPLQIKHYKQHPETGARTYLVRVQPGVEIPWEVHDVAEEVYMIAGEYRLAECLPGGKAVGTYRQGGYFYRPPGIAHNGPDSGAITETIMLIRTPGPLTVELVDGCD